jgi:hypothetical protein
MLRAVKRKEGCMYRDDLPTGGWNLFARVLQEILALHSMTIRQFI